MGSFWVDGVRSPFFSPFFSDANVGILVMYAHASHSCAFKFELRPFEGHYLMIKNLIFSLIFVAFSGFYSFALALELELGVSAEAGIDRKTRKWIESLPEKIRLEVIKALEDALPLVDKSIHSYLDHVDKIMASTVTDVGCQVQAAGKNTIDYLGSTITFSGMPKPIDNLLDEQARYKTRFRRNTTPTLYAHGYADLVGNISLTRCQLQHAPEVIPRVELIMTDSLARFHLWVRLEDEGVCDSAKDCYAKKLATVRDLSSRADLRDKLASDADTILAGVQNPEGSVIGQFRQGPYEAALMQIYRAEDSLMLAKTLRISSAQKYLNAANNDLSKVDSAYASAVGSLSARPNLAIDSANNALVSLVAVEALIKKAEDTALELTEQIRVQRERIAQLKSMLLRLKLSAAEEAAKRASELKSDRGDNRATGGDKAGGMH